MWRAVWRTRRPGLDVDAMIDGAHPCDVEPLTQYLYAMCSRPGQVRDDYAWAAVRWLQDGTLELPRGATPLDVEGMSCLPPPYKERTTTV